MYFIDVFVFQHLQDLDVRRIDKIKSVIEASASIESSVLPIIKTCIDGMNKASQSISAEEVMPLYTFTYILYCLSNVYKMKTQAQLCWTHWS